MLLLFDDFRRPPLLLFFDPALGGYISEDEEKAAAEEEEDIEIDYSKVFPSKDFEEEKSLLMVLFFCCSFRGQTKKSRFLTFSERREKREKDSFEKNKRRKSLLFS